MLMDKRALERGRVCGDFVLLGHDDCSKRWPTEQDALPHRGSLQVSAVLFRRSGQKRNCPSTSVASDFSAAKPVPVG